MYNKFIKPIVDKMFFICYNIVVKYKEIVNMKVLTAV